MIGKDKDTANLITTNWLSNKVMVWNDAENTRQMPWKGEKNPYFIWLSEIILQQTRVEQGLAYYRRFIYYFPNVRKLASADEKKLMKLWEGLGYYSRCRNLHKAAKIIVADYHGIFPTNYEDILKLPGVGPYTAAAISSFAYNEPYAVVDGNVVRVLSRFFGSYKSINTTVGKRWFGELAQRLLPKKKAGLYNQAIMDLGAVICKPLKPQCEICPLQKKCIAFLLGKQQEFPVKKKRVRKRQRWFSFLILIKDGKVLIQKRVDNDIWKGLYQFPIYETSSLVPVAQLNKRLAKDGLQIKLGKVAFSASQNLTHQIIHGRFYILSVTQSFNGINGEWLTPRAAAKRAFPKMPAIFLNNLGCVNGKFDGSFSNK